MRRLAWLPCLTIVLMTSTAGTPATAQGEWLWPVTGPVIRSFDPPDSPYGSGHRGIDIAVPEGTTIRAPASGVVTFAGSVGGRLFITIDHGAGVLSTCSWVSALLVGKGVGVTKGQPIARTGTGHPGDVIPSLHFGVRLDGEYVDPLLYLGPVSVSGFIRLAPIAPASAA